MVTQKIGAIAFILGIVVAIVAGVLAGFVGIYAGWITLVLVVLGLVIGFLNVGDKDVTGFLIAAIALMAVGTARLEAIPFAGIYVASIVVNVAAFVAPAALVVALKEVWNIAKEPA